jgi:hypothetical protein
MDIRQAFTEPRRGMIMNEALIEGTGERGIDRFTQAGSLEFGMLN